MNMVRPTLSSQDRRAIRSRRPRSAFRLPPCPLRRGITLTEVLISMGILALGLLGVAAMFPVGGYYMQRAEISDRGSQIAQAAMNDLLARGMLDPRNWRMLVTSPKMPLLPPLQVDAAPFGQSNAFRRSVSAALSEDLAESATWSSGQRQRRLARRIGHAFVIDPLGIALTSLPANALNGYVAVFPASALSPPSGGGYWWNWRTWWGNGGADYTWPIRRVTFAQPGSSNGAVMDPVTAEHYFRGRDDLVTDFPDRDDRPAIQAWDIAATDINGDGYDANDPLARQWAGDYSWIASVVPTTNAARDALATNPESFAYDVTVVVFYKRVLETVPPTNGAELNAAGSSLANNERFVRATVVSTSPNGGEVLLDKIGTGTEDPFKELRAGQWIMMCGPHPAGTRGDPEAADTDPRFALQWYEVIAVEGERERLNSDGTTIPPPASNEPQRRLVTLRGSQWPWLPPPTGTSDPNHLSRNLCVAICPGAVAAHRRTIRLEGGTAFGTGEPSNSALPVPHVTPRPIGPQ